MRFSAPPVNSNQNCHSERGYLLRVPGRCLSLVYCSRAPCAQPYLPHVDEGCGNVELHHRWEIFWSYSKFQRKLSWLKIIVLMLFRRDFLLATYSQRVVGLLGIRFDKLSHLPLHMHEACIYLVQVIDEYKGLRIGLRLVETAKNFLHQDGYTIVLLETGEYNDAMIRLLSRSSFELCGYTLRSMPSKKLDKLIF